MPMKNPPHPGRIVRQECLEPLGLSVTDGAKALGVSRNALSEIVNERRGISPEMAIRQHSRSMGGDAAQLRHGAGHEARRRDQGAAGADACPWR
jgi:addiction module HigA family antidote